MFLKFIITSRPNISIERRFRALPTIRLKVEDEIGAVSADIKRVIKVKAQLSREGQRVFVYEDPRSGDLFQIADPNLQLQQLEGVQHEVLQLLQHGLPEESPADSVTMEPAAPAPEQQIETSENVAIA